MTDVQTESLIFKILSQPIKSRKARVEMLFAPRKGLNLSPSFTHLLSLHGLEAL